MRIELITKTVLRTALGAGLLAGVAHAQTPVFTPGFLAVLQEGDGGPGRCVPLGAISGITSYSASDITGSRQNQLFIDQFDPNGTNQTVPSVQIAIPTNGPGAMLLNGNAGTEGNLSLAGDKSVVTFAAYQGDILSITTGQQTAPSNLSYDRGIGTVDAFGNYANPYRGGGWYGIATGKTNPRGVATDGANNFWGCGNGYGSLYYNPAITSAGPIQFQNIALTSCSKVINHQLYASVKSSESVNLYPAGVYSFVDFYNNPVPYPESASFLHLEIQAQAPYTTCIGFDINPQSNGAYLADSTYGVQKYIKSGLAWQLAYNLAIPGYNGLTTGILTNANSTNVLSGCFSVTVDWSGTNPIVYATTTDTGNAGSTYYGNRVIRINDTNTITSGASIIITTNMNILTTVVKPPGTGLNQLTNIVYKSVTFTPDLRPVITSQPSSVTAAVGDNVNFGIGATSPYTMTYQWQENGTNLSGQVSSTLALTGVDLSYNGATFDCIVSNTYGGVTSAVATLTVGGLTPPVLSPMQNLTNYVGNNQTITAAFVSGTDPKGGYQWYLNGALLSDGPTASGSTLSGTATSSLNIVQAGASDAGVYSLSVTNLAGSASNAVAQLYMLYAPPAMIQPPIALTTFLGRNTTNVSAAYGALLNYQWYTSTNKTSPIATGLKPLSDNGHYVGTGTPALAILSATNSDATNYVVVVSNPGGSITSAPVALTVVAVPAHSFVAYTNSGQPYFQDFNSLPINGGTSTEGANPVSITYAMTNFAAMLTNGSYALSSMASSPTYSFDNPVDFGYPVLANGSIGGFGLGKTMSGWYGWAQNLLWFGATKGDQSQGAILDNGGNYYADGTSLASITNRALGLIATTKSGIVAFGAAFMNNSTNTYSLINLSYLGELWRNNPNQQALQFGYTIDPAGSNSVFQPSQWDSTNGITYLTSLNVAFPTTADTEIDDGTQASNQINLATSALAITNWPPHTALWLIWQGQTLGSAQDVAIDNLSFAAGMIAPPTVIVQAASPINQVSATLNALVTPNDAATTVYFQYGTSTSYGSFTATNSLPTGITQVPLSFPLAGLSPKTTYHFMAVASNSLGTTSSADYSFTTPAVVPPKLGNVVLGTAGLQFSFTNTPGLSFTTLGTTNVALPLSQWQNLGHPVEGPAGHFQFIDAQALTNSPLFYIIRQP